MADDRPLWMDANSGQPSRMSGARRRPPHAQERAATDPTRLLWRVGVEPRWPTMARREALGVALPGGDHGSGGWRGTCATEQATGPFAPDDGGGSLAIRERPAAMGCADHGTGAWQHDAVNEGQASVP